MRDIREDNVTEAVLDKIQDMKDPRLKKVLSAAIKHIHQFARDVELTNDELFMGAMFLTKIGQISDETRHEFLLLSDTLGLTILADAMQNRKPPGATESSVLGPFYRTESPLIENDSNIEREGKGEPTIVSGKVTSLDGTPLEGAMLDIWQGAANGFYENVDPDQPDQNLRGRLLTATDGGYSFKTCKPVSYPIPDDGPVGQMLDASGRHIFRPAHIHFIVSAEGHKTVTTEIFVEGDEYLDSDAVFGVKDSLVADFVKHDSADEAKAAGVAAPFYTMNFDFVLEPGKGGQIPEFTTGRAKS